MKYREYVDPVCAERLLRHLPLATIEPSDWRLLPDGTKVLIGTEHVWAITESKPAPCAVDLGGDVAFVLWKDGAK